MSIEESGKKILSLNFNQTNVKKKQTLLSVGTTKGFRVLRLESSKMISKRDDDPGNPFPGGFSHVVPVFSTALICLVGSAANSRYPLNIVYFWDEHLSETKAEIRFRSEVKNVLIRRDQVVIVLEKITYVYMLNSLKPVNTVETISNERGVAAISYDKDIFVMLTLCSEPGSLRMENCYSGETKTAQMHENPIYIVAVDFGGHYGASASEQGTIIRVFECARLEPLYELRRGTSPALISSIAFSPQQSFLLVTSNKSTVHVWRLEKKPQNYSGMFSKYLPNYFQYLRSVGKITLKPEIEWTCPFTSEIGPKGCFLTENQFCIAQLDGNLHRCTIDPVSGNISVLSTEQFLDFTGGSLIRNSKNWSSLE